MTIGRFMCGITALIWNPQTDQYLLLKRAGHRDAGAGEWECVTGRVDQGEAFEDAVYREVREELGVEARIVFIIGTSHFYRGEAKGENEMLGVRYLCTLDHPDAIQITDEHEDYRWLSADEIEQLLSPDHWLIPTFRSARTMMPFYRMFASTNATSADS